MLVLVCDDDAQIRDLISRILTRLGHHVVAVGTGADLLASKEIGAGTVGAIILDVKLPDMTIDEIIEGLKAKSYKSLIIVSSGYSIEKIDLKSSDGLTVKYLPKPFTIKDLTEVIHHDTQ